MSSLMFREQKVIALASPVSYYFELVVGKIAYMFHQTHGLQLRQLLYIQDWETEGRQEQ